MAFHPVSLIPPIVASTIEESYGQHRTTWFEGVLEQIGESIAPALPPSFTPLILTATVSGAREAIVANCVAAGVDVWVSPQDGAFAPLVDGFRSTSGSDRLLALIEHVNAAGRLLPLTQTLQSLR